MLRNCRLCEEYRLRRDCIKTVEYEAILGFTKTLDFLDKVGVTETDTALILLAIYIKTAECVSSVSCKVKKIYWELKLKILFFTSHV